MPPRSPQSQQQRIHPTTERAIKTWAAQKLLMFSGKEGFAPSSVIGRIRDERDGASQPGVSKQVFLEVYERDGLDVHLVVQHLDPVARAVLFCYYAFHFKGQIPITIDDQCKYLVLAKPIYLDKLHAAQLAVETGLGVLEMMRTRSSTRQAVNS